MILEVSAIKKDGTIIFKEEREYKNTGRPANPMGKVIVKWDPTERMLVVEDNGIGIEAKHLESVGQPFYSTKAWKKQGTGFGVSSVKKLLAKSGSKLEVSSTWGRGSSFSFTLPLATPEQLQEYKI